MNALAAVVAKASAASSLQEPFESPHLPAIHKTTASTSSRLTEVEKQQTTQASGVPLQQLNNTPAMIDEYEVVHSYEASHDDELSVGVGEVVCRVNGAVDCEVDEGWIRVENARGDVGLVPEVILEKQAAAEPVRGSNGEVLVL